MQTSQVVAGLIFAIVAIATAGMLTYSLRSRVLPRASKVVLAVSCSTAIVLLVMRSVRYLAGPGPEAGWDWLEAWASQVTLVNIFLWFALHCFSAYRAGARGRHASPHGRAA